MMYADNTRGRNFTKDPAVVFYKGSYYMYYTIPAYGDGRENDGHAIGIAKSDDLEEWKRIGELLPEQLCDKKGICAPGAIVLGDRIHLFYQTYGNFPKDAICHAVSKDGVHFERDETNPVFAPKGEWNNGRAIDADLVSHDGKLLLYFATRDPEGRIQKLGVASAPIGSAFNRNDWTQECSSSILGPELPWEQECIEAPAVCKHDGRLYMFYGGAYNNCPQQIGCAASNDGIRWKRLSNVPFLPNGGKGAWNECESGHPYIFVDKDDRYYLFFQGNNDMGKSWYISKVEIGWKEGRPYII